MVARNRLELRGVVRRAFVYVLGVVLAASVPSEAQDPVFRAGAATSNITPPLGVSIAGHMGDRTVQHIHDELHVRCLVLDNGTTTLAFAVVDSCMVPKSIFDAAKARAAEATGIPAGHIMASASHTHSAPAATGVFQSEPDPDYQEFLTQRIADGITRAHTNLEPARLGWGVGSVPGEVFNRRWKMEEGAIGPNPFGETGETALMNPPRASADLVEPWGPTDPDVWVLAVESEHGDPIAVYANYALHYVGGVPGGEVSADYFGVFANRMAELLEADDQQPPFVAMLSNGASGDINNINFREPAPSREPYEQMTIVGNKVAREAKRVYDEIAFRDWVPLRAANETLSLGVRLPSDEDVAEARERVGDPGQTGWSDRRAIYARETLLLSDYPAEVPVPLQAFRVGSLAIGAIPCEVFVEIGVELKESSPFENTFVVELANGYNGYLPTERQHGLGGYETWRARSSYLEVGAAEKIAATVQSLFNELHE